MSIDFAPFLKLISGAVTQVIRALVSAWA